MEAARARRTQAADGTRQGSPGVSLRSDQLPFPREDRDPEVRLPLEERVPELRLPLEELPDRAPVLRLGLDDRLGEDTREGAELRDGALPVRIWGAREGADLGEDERAPGADVLDEDGREPTVDRVLVRVEGLEPTDERALGASEREPMDDRVRVEVRVPADEVDGDVDRDPVVERVLERVEVRTGDVEREDVVPRVEVTPREVEPNADRVVREPGSERTVLRAVRVTSEVLVAVDVPPRTTLRVPKSERESEAREARPPRFTPAVPRPRRPPEASDERPIVVPRGAQLLRPLPRTTTPGDHHGL